ncbi:hypothetical protein ACSBR2_016327 [Camellia fascicularis]
MIRLQIMNMRSDRRLISNKLNKVLCPRMDSVLEKAFLDGRTWIEINVYPCQYAVAAIFRSGKNLNSFIEPFFHADMYRQAYSFFIGPVPTVEKPLCSIEDAMILPPLSKRPAGKPKKNIIASTGKFKRVIKCSRCESMVTIIRGHARNLC